MKRVLKIILIAFLGLFIALLIAPILFRGKFISLLENQIENYVDAEVSFTDADLSFIKSFPSICVSMDSLRIDGREAFEDITLYKSERSSFVTDWKSVIRPSSGINIESIELTDADFHMVIDSTGAANYNIVKEKESDKEYFGSIKSYRINESNLLYEDRSNGFQLELIEMDHRGRGRFENVRFDLKTQTFIAATNVSYNGISYLQDAGLMGQMDIGIDLDSQIYVLKDNLLQLNELAFSLTGQIQNSTEEVEMDLSLNAVNNRVEDILSLVPNIMVSDFDEVSSEGQGSVSARINGIYSREKEVLPSVQANITIENGNVSFPQLNVPVKNLNAQVEVKAQETDWTDMRIHIPSFVFDLDRDRIMGSLDLANLFGNPEIRTTLMGELDMARLSRLFDTGDLEIREGKISTDLELSTDQASIKNKRYAQMNFDGTAVFKDWRVQLPEQNVNFDSINLKFNPASATGSVRNLDIDGQTFSGKVVLEDPLMLMTDGPKPLLKLDVYSDRLDLDMLQNKLATNTDSITQKRSSQKTLSVPVDLDIAYRADTVIYAQHDIRRLKTHLTYIGDVMTLKEGQLRLDGQNVSVTGQISPIFGYLQRDQTLEGGLTLNASMLDLDQFLNGGEKPEDGDAATAPEVPSNISLSVDFTSDVLVFKEYRFENFRGNLALDQGNLILTDTYANVMGGDAVVEGSYRHENDKPLFDFRFQMDKIDFEKMVSQSEMFNALAPVARYIDGFFNATLVMSGPLDDQLKPELDRISASGFLETLDGRISGFKPLVVLGEKLGIEKIKNWKLADSRNWFEVDKGVIQLKEKTYEIDDMSFTVAGQHTLENKINYTLLASIPRALLKNKAIGKEIAYSFDKIEEIAAERGIRLDLGDNIYLNVRITGSIGNPSVNIEPTGSGGESIDELVRQELDNQISKARKEIEEKVDEETEKLRDTLGGEIQKKKDELESKVREKADTTAAKIREDLGKKIDSTRSEKLDELEDKAGTKAEEVFGPAAKEQIDSIKSKLDKWNPLKKSKKEGY